MKTEPSMNTQLDNINEDNSAIVTTESFEIKCRSFPLEEFKNTEKKNKTWCSYMEKGFRASRDISEMPTAGHSDSDESGVSNEKAGETIHP